MQLKHLNEIMECFRRDSGQSLRYLFVRNVVIWHYVARANAVTTDAVIVQLVQFS